MPWFVECGGRSAAIEPNVLNSSGTNVDVGCPGATAAKLVVGRHPPAHQPHLLRHRRRVLDHRDPQRHTDLRRGQAHARRRVHRDAQGLDEAGQQGGVELAVEALGAAPQDRVARRDDGQRAADGE